MAQKATKSAILPKSKRIEKAPRKTQQSKLAAKKAANNSAPTKPTKRVLSMVKVKKAANSSQSEERKSTAKASKVSKSNATSEKKYYQNFDFYFKRTSFRTMTNYFKAQYNPFIEQWKAKAYSSVKESLEAFANKEFPGLLGTLNRQAAVEFIELLKLLVYSHRHNKFDDYLRDPLINFEIIRQPMYKYSRE